MKTRKYVVIWTFFVLTAVLISGGLFWKNMTAEAEEPVISLALEGDFVNQGFFRGAADAVITVQERLFDSSSLSISVRDETGRVTELTYDEERGQWKGLDGLGELSVEAVAYKTEGGSVFLLDSESGEEVHTDERIIQMRFRFSKEGKYEIEKIVCGDLAGNQSVLENAACITVDKTEPELQIMLPEMEGSGRDGYYDRPVTVWLYLKEHNFHPEERPEIRLIRGENTVEELSAGELSWKEAPEKGSDWYKTSILCTEDAAYHMYVTYEDPAGWSLSENSACETIFTVDASPPEYGNIKALGQSWGSFLEHVTFGLFSSREELVLLEGGDSVSPIEALQYYCSEDILTIEKLEELPEQDWVTGNALLLEPDSKTVVYLKVTNYAGLSSYFNSEGILIEDHGPDITLMAEGDKAEGKWIYRSDVSVQVTVRETESTGISSGIRQAGYRIEAEGEQSIEEGVLMEAENTDIGEGEWEVRIPAENYNEKQVSLFVWAEDFAGNRSEKSISFAIDRTAPEIRIEYDRTAPDGGRYYNEIRTAKVIIREKNFVKEQAGFKITNTEGIMPEISEWEKEGDAYFCTVIFAADGDYSFAVSCEDGAGNGAEKSGGDFTVDRTSPKIEVTFEEAEEGRGQFFRTSRKAEITVNEHNFHGEGLRGRILFQEEGTGEQIIREIKEEDFQSAGDIHRAEIQFEENGSYRICLSVADKAGNRQEGDEYKTEFIIDKNSPKIEINGVTDKSANRGNVETVITCCDTYLDPENCFARLERLDDRESLSENADVYMEEQDKTIRFFLNDLPYEPEMDGMYLLTVCSIDMAGNKKERAVIFSVNRFGSVYMASEDTKEWLCPEDGSYPYLNGERDVVVREYNVDPVEKYQVAAGHDGEIRILKEGEDYARRKLEETGWYVYEYRIQKKNFEEEGNYEVVLYSEDAAGNRMGNVSAKAEDRQAAFEFSVDKTGPSVFLSGAEDGGYYDTDELEVFLTVRDNMFLSKVEVCVGDKKEIYEGKGNGVIAFSVKEAEDWQILTVQAEDAAGNGIGTGIGAETAEDGTMVWRLFVNSSHLLCFIKKTRYFIFILPLCGIAAGITVVIFLKRKRERKAS